MKKLASDLKIVKRKVDSLVEAPYNPRQLTTRAYEHLKASMERFGFVEPLVVNINSQRKNIVIGGNHRLQIARALKYSEVPCVEIDLPLEKERELNIRLNKNNGEWDFDDLANNFDINELQDWGFEKWELPPMPEMGQTSTNEQRTLKDADIVEAEAVNYKVTTCPKCGHKFHARSNLNPKHGLNQYKKAASKNGR
jgi:hypothetical protein